MIMNSRDKDDDIVSLIQVLIKKTLKNNGNLIRCLNFCFASLVNFVFLFYTVGSI